MIERFSADIDVTVFRDDLSEPASVEELEALSGKKRQARLDAIEASCRAFISGPPLDDLGDLIEHTMRYAGIPADRAHLELDDTDPDRQTLLFWYPSVAGEPGGYIRSEVKIESGAKSALDPHRPAVVTPYASEDIARLNRRVPNVITVDPERTSWDKLVILHGLRRWFERRGVLRQGGQRVTRHYHDVSRLTESDVAGQHLTR